MAAKTETPLQAVVSVICDVLCELPIDDQARALEAVRVTLGLRPVTAIARGRNALNQVRDVLEPALPIVRVQMMGDRPVVENDQMNRPGGPLVALGRQRQSRPRDQSGQARGYIRALR